MMDIVWIIGFFFTVGMTFEDIVDKKWYWFALYLIGCLLFWPVFFGVFARVHYEDR